MSALAQRIEEDLQSRAANDDDFKGGPWNRTKYAYVNNNPMSFIDPSGFTPFSDILGSMVRASDVLMGLVMCQDDNGDPCGGWDVYHQALARENYEFMMGFSTQVRDWYQTENAALIAAEQAQRQAQCPPVPYACNPPRQGIVTTGPLEDVPQSQTSMESRKGERNWEGKNPDPKKGVKPIRDDNGEVIGWREKTADGKGKDKSLEWGRQNGLKPEDFPQNNKSVTISLVVGGAVVVGGIVCAILEPCGAAVGAAAAAAVGVAAPVAVATAP